MGPLGAFIVLILILGLGAAAVTLGMGLWTVPGQCDKVCKACDCVKAYPLPIIVPSGPTPTPAPTTKMGYPMF